jgi:hypothetical protein
MTAGAQTIAGATTFSAGSIFSAAPTLTAASNQLVFQQSGTGFKHTLNSANPAADRVFSLPDRPDNYIQTGINRYMSLAADQVLTQADSGLNVQLNDAASYTVTLPTTYVGGTHFRFLPNNLNSGNNITITAGSAKIKGYIHSTTALHRYITSAFTRITLIGRLTADGQVGVGDMVEFIGTGAAGSGWTIRATIGNVNTWEVQ